MPCAARRPDCPDAKTAIARDRAGGWRMKSRRVLFTCHDAGGTIPPMLAVAEALVRSGHDVSILSQPSVKRRAEGAGCAFVAFSALPDYQRRKPLEEQFDVSVPAITGSSVGDDVIAVARKHKADLIVVDANLGGGLAAAEALAQPSVVLLHSMYKTFVDTWFADFWPLIGSAINETRSGYGLAAVDGWPSAFAGHERIFSVVPTMFDAAVSERAHHHALLRVPDAARYGGRKTGKRVPPRRRADSPRRSQHDVPGTRGAAPDDPRCAGRDHRRERSSPQPARSTSKRFTCRRT